jgi:hypothetical protein
LNFNKTQKQILWVKFKNVLIRKCIDSNTFPSFTQSFFFSIMLALTFKLCIVFYFLPKHGIPT